MRDGRWTAIGGRVWPFFVALAAAFAPSADAGPAVDVSRTLIGYNNVGHFVNIIQPVFVTNVGDAPLNISSISLGGTNPTDFRLGGTCAAPIVLAASGGRCRIDITSDADLSGGNLRIATLTIVSDASPSAPIVSISASIDDGITGPFVKPAYIDFPAQTVGTSAATQILTFTNILSATFSFPEPVFVRGDSTDFTASTNCGLLTPDASCTFTIGFVPTAAGPRSTELEIDFYPADSPMTKRFRRYSITGVGGVAGPIQPTQVVEYYNATLDHYFISWVKAEQDNLDAGKTPTKWNRTGKVFNTYTMPQSSTSPVCRYYIPPGKGDSHFFGRGTDECNATGQKNPTFVLEDPAFMNMILPMAGVCPARTTNIYRVFSNRPDANHRYMTDKTVRDQMVAKGWVAEGDGPDLVVMCAP